MSYTSMYKIGGGECETIATFKNSWRGSMYVWNQIAKDYFDLDSFPMFDIGGDMNKRIWNAHNEKPITDCEYIVLSASMDKAIVKATPENLSILIKAFREYGHHHPNSSYTEQADILNATDEMSVLIFNDTDYIVWQQTSCGGFWAEGEYSEETEECEYYNPLESSDHFDVIDEFKLWKNAETLETKT